MENEREIRLTEDDLDRILKNAKLVEVDEVVSRAYFEPGELVIKVVK